MKQAIHTAHTLQATGTGSPALRCGSGKGLFDWDGRGTRAARFADAHMNPA